MQIIRTPVAGPTLLSPPHSVALGASRWLAAAMVAGHAALIVALPVARPDLASWMIGLLWPCLAYSLFRALTLHAWRRAADAVIRVEIDLAGAVLLGRRDGSRLRATLLGTSTIHPWAVVLNLRNPPGAAGRSWPRSVIIARDACDAAAFRRLRVWLRWGCGPDSGKEASDA